MRPQLDPAKLQLLGERVLVKPYVLPESSASGIIIPEEWRRDRTWSHYEYVDASDKALRRLGISRKALHPGAIIRTRLKLPVDTGFDDPADGQRLMILLAEEVAAIQLWQPTEEEDNA